MLHQWKRVIRWDSETARVGYRRRYVHGRPRHPFTERDVIRIVKKLLEHEKDPKTFKKRFRWNGELQNLVWRMFFDLVSEFFDQAFDRDSEFWQPTEERIDYFRTLRQGLSGWWKIGQLSRSGAGRRKTASPGGSPATLEGGLILNQLRITMEHLQALLREGKELTSGQEEARRVRKQSNR